MPAVRVEAPVHLAHLRDYAEARSGLALRNRETAVRPANGGLLNVFSRQSVCISSSQRELPSLYQFIRIPATTMELQSCPRADQMWTSSRPCRA